MEEEGPTDLEYGMMPNEHPSVEWRSRGITDVNQSRPRSYRPRGGGGSKNMPERSPRKRVPKQMEEGVPSTPPIRARRIAGRRQP